MRTGAGSKREIHVCMCIHVCIYVHMMCVHVCARVCLHTCTHVCACACVYARCVCMHIRVQVHECAHTYTRSSPSEPLWPIQGPGPGPTTSKARQTGKEGSWDLLCPATHSLCGRGEFTLPICKTMIVSKSPCTSAPRGRGQSLLPGGACSGLHTAPAPRQWLTYLLGILEMSIFSLEAM